MFQMQPDGSVKVPVPFNAATQYNYIVLDYPVMSTPDNPVSYAAPARNRFLYFCEAVEELAPNTTLCHVQLDVWSTYINSVDVSGMMLARGHAPMASVTATDYLKNPSAGLCKLVTSSSIMRSDFCVSESIPNKVYTCVQMLPWAVCNSSPIKGTLRFSTVTDSASVLRRLVPSIAGSPP